MDYRVNVIERGGQWVAFAQHPETGDRFGIECVAPTADGAREKLMRWIQWQEAHTSALAALQQAERDYHRTIAGSAFANPSEGPSAIEMQKDALEQVEAARIRLDEIRAAKPD